MKTLAELQAAFAQLGKLERRRADKAAKLQAKIAALQAKPEYPNESYRLDALARAYMLEHPETSYYNAVIACIRQTDY
ncbi:hypothetical protein [Neisseria elongata]|uniref:hypothetical protein n=1 Tax=Neisseria elongata TaxID=495 RepID=UPI00195828C2|nr:hypothetical protein [Neisseria elongata]